ncbi:hypothetical protein AMATHDRAFT_46564 [Amanita thiersii Skay4041]|uniref:Uncharacterized protein n=1 Tax=Amanita thiersii Skay4041 TaxID=703135 RepID=A0A2A9NV85_9AGAR|nr:hypothetical protein AMATHDRAFT_46564 [Amanita thiersii Skay4041]
MANLSFEISDDELDEDCHHATQMLWFKQVKDFMPRGPPRCIAGTGRVSNYRQKKGLVSTPAAAVQVLQSITTIPALADRSFEEIRLECYNQSVVATGKPPRAVNALLNPSTVIPPLFIPVRDECAEDPLLEVDMSNAWYICFWLQT